MQIISAHAGGPSLCKSPDDLRIHAPIVKGFRNRERLVDAASGFKTAIHRLGLPFYERETAFRARRLPFVKKIGAVNLGARIGAGFVRSETRPRRRRELSASGSDRPSFPNAEYRQNPASLALRGRSLGDRRKFRRRPDCGRNSRYCRVHSAFRRETASTRKPAPSRRPARRRHAVHPDPRKRPWTSGSSAKSQVCGWVGLIRPKAAKNCPPLTCRPHGRSVVCSKGLLELDLGFVVVVQLQNDVGEALKIGIDRTVEREL